MAKALTAQSVERLKPDPEKRLEVPDGLLPGLYLIIQPNGSKSWAVRYRHAGEPRKLTLGPYPALELGTARGRGREALQAAATGRDPAAEKRRLSAKEKKRGLTAISFPHNLMFLSNGIKGKRASPICGGCGAYFEPRSSAEMGVTPRPRYHSPRCCGTP